MNNTPDTEITSSKLTKKDAEAYADEHRRLESIIQDSENIWEDRTFQIAAGGLTLTFTVFSFLSTQGVEFDWQIILIWIIYAVCILANYASHLFAVRMVRKMQSLLGERINLGKEYDHNELNEQYHTPDRRMREFNMAVHIVLTCNVIYTLIYTSIHLI